MRVGLILAVVVVGCSGRLGQIVGAESESEAEAEAEAEAESESEAEAESEAESESESEAESEAEFESESESESEAEAEAESESESESEPDPFLDLAFTLGGAGDHDFAYGVATGTDGSIVVAGYFFGTVDFNPDPLFDDSQTAAGNYDAFVVRFSADGTEEWARTFGGTGEDYARAVAVAPDGSIYVTGYFEGTADFDPGELPDERTAQGHDGFIVKFGSEGSYQWAQAFGGSEAEKVFATAASDDAVVVCGQFQSAVDFDPGDSVDEHTAVGSDDGFISYFDSAGVFGWARTVSGSGKDVCEGVAFWGDGSVVAAGAFRDDEDDVVDDVDGVDFNPDPDTVELRATLGNAGAYAWKLNPVGDYVWATTWVDGDAGTSFEDVAVGGPNEDVALTGIAYGTVYLAPDSTDEVTTVESGTDVFVTKLDADGSYLWGTSFGGPSTDYGDTGGRIALASDGAVAVVGLYAAVVDFDPTEGSIERLSLGARDVFLSTFSNEGEFTGVRVWGGSGDDESEALAIDLDGRMVVAGGFRFSVDFDPGEDSVVLGTTDDNFDAFVLRFLR